MLKFGRSCDPEMDPNSCIFACLQCVFRKEMTWEKWTHMRNEFKMREFKKMEHSTSENNNCTENWEQRCEHNLRANERDGEKKIKIKRMEKKNTQERRTLTETTLKMKWNKEKTPCYSTNLQYIDIFFFQFFFCFIFFVCLFFHVFFFLDNLSAVCRLCRYTILLHHSFFFFFVFFFFFFHFHFRLNPWHCCSHTLFSIRAHSDRFLQVFFF